VPAPPGAAVSTRTTVTNAAIDAAVAATNGPEVSNGQAGPRDASTTDPSETTIASRATISTDAPIGTIGTSGTIAPTAPHTSKTTLAACATTDGNPLHDSDVSVGAAHASVTIFTCKSLQGFTPIHATVTGISTGITVCTRVTAEAILTRIRIYTCQDNARIPIAKQVFSKGIADINVRKRQHRGRQGDYRHRGFN
jgi:hypothetical protein